MQNINLELKMQNSKIPNLRFTGLFSQSIVFKTGGLQNIVVSICDKN